ncbi:MAG: hypothetical protein A2Z29_11260 [Chloroflexi bacterium RBG_16_56_11]|nr:MAG: hypothetical protein A2Z29_11260 [Chloroflexi bacterium RBG_16_56_11]
MKPVYLLTGRPGTGKTSIIKQVAADPRIKADGFFTEEIRERGTRVGFRLVTLDGLETVLAHVNFNKRYHVGKYGVDVAALEEVGVPALLTPARDGLTIVDEIGKMELLSAAFREAVKRIVDGGKKVLGTITSDPHPDADAIKLHPNVKVINLTREYYPQVVVDLYGWLGITPNPDLRFTLYNKNARIVS